MMMLDKIKSIVAHILLFAICFTVIAITLFWAINSDYRANAANRQSDWNIAPLVPVITRPLR